MPDEKFYRDFEKRLLASIKRSSKRVQRIYADAILNVSLTAASVEYPGKQFNLDLYPAIKQKIDSVLVDMHKHLRSTINQATKEAWYLSNEKNDVATRKLLGKKDLPKYFLDNVFNPNEKALQAFQQRRRKGLNLSKRVWNTLEPFKHELEAGIAAGVNEGKSAIAMAAEMKRYLNEPDKLFRRVRDKNGNLQLSKAARAYHPGQGVYRSSHKNAMRLTRTETNMAYRNSDIARWQTQPFVLGYEIKLSLSHPKYDICDPLAGKYPKTFNWAGWHPQCLCYAVPVLAEEDEFERMENEILGIETKPAEFNYINEMPKAFKDYWEQNKKRIGSWKNKPYWVADNPHLVGKDPVVDYQEESILRMNVGALQHREKTFGTDSLFKDRDTGDYIESRQVLHEKIVSGYLGRGSTQNGVSYFMGGAPATGKSSILALAKLPEGIMTVDPDAVKGMIPEYQEMVKRGDMSAAARVHEESSTIGASITASALQKGFDLVVDGVGDGTYKKVAGKVAQHREAGKRVVANYVTTATEVSLTRASARAKETGREVPENYIRSMHQEISKLVPQFLEKNLFDEFRLYNNDVKPGEAPILILEQIDGKLSIYEQGLYDQFLKQASH